MIYKFYSVLAATMLSATVLAQENAKPQKTSGFQIGGYGEAVATYNFFSDSYLRYTDATNYKNSQGHGRVDLPHMVIWLGYDFGRGWSLGSEIEFEHGGTESAVEIEEEEGGEYESEVERGGEVALEQFWIQKSFSKALNLRMGHIIVPVGETNMYHLPTEFFTCYRPEGESTILPCTWHETGISLWGKLGNWRYEALLLPGLDSERFSRKGWIAEGAGSPYEFKIANTLACAFRVDNYSVKGLRLSLSGYVGNSFRNTLKPSTSSKYQGVKGTVLIGSFGLCYNDHNCILRANFDYGHLSDSDKISAFNLSLPNASPSPSQAIGSDAIAAGAEFGYDIFGHFDSLKKYKFYVFGRYEYYDSMAGVSGGVIDVKYCSRQRFAAGINFYPMKEIVVKAEYSYGLLHKAYNNEPSVSIGIAYSGLFKR